MKSNDKRQRDPIDHLALLVAPVKPNSRSRRASQSWSQKCFVTDLANKAILGLSQLWKGRLDDTVIEHQEGRYRMEVTTDKAGVETEIADRIGKRLPPADRPIGDAAIKRLRGERGMNPPSGKVESFDYKKMVQRIEEDLKKGIKGGPKKGDMFPSHWEHVALPPPGSKPVDIAKVSRRARRYLQNYETEMLRADRGEAMEKSEVQPYMDGHPTTCGS
jgi:hypothetical protein